jgi:chromosomal replication initiator protein
VLEYIAYNINTNVREMQGALISLIAQSSLNHKDIDLELAKKIIKNFVKNITKEISIDTIQKIVSEYFGLTQDKLKEKSRKREIVQARQLSMHFAKTYTKSSLKQIGKYFGGKDHSTVIHSCQTVRDLMDVDDTFKGYVDDINKKIKLNTP